MERREVDDKAFFGGLIVGPPRISDRGKPWTPPKQEMPTREEVVDWLNSKHISMWGAQITMAKEGPWEAAEWILGQVNSFLEWRKQQ